MKKSKILILAILAAIFITLLVIPVKVSAGTLRDGRITYINGKPTCNCLSYIWDECYCLIKE